MNRHRISEQRNSCPVTLPTASRTLHFHNEVTSGWWEEACARQHPGAAKYMQTCTRVLMHPQTHVRERGSVCTHV